MGVSAVQACVCWEGGHGDAVAEPWGREGGERAEVGRAEVWWEQQGKVRSGKSNIYTALLSRLGFIKSFTQLFKQGQA